MHLVGGLPRHFLYNLFSIGTSTRREELRNDTPGPGAYDSPGKIVSNILRI